MLSFTNKRWVVSDYLQGDVTSFLANQRGIDLSREATLPNPHDLEHIDRACARICKAISMKEKVAIIGDYDCDGITGALILERMFVRHGITPFVRLPDRLAEGYGVKEHMIEEAHAEGAVLVLTVDTGITAVGPVSRAAGLGIDVIITDHHAPQEELPYAHSIVHPMLSPRYPEPHPCGAGVAYLLVAAVEERLGSERYTWNGNDIDLSLAAIGTVADIVPLLGGNRAIVQRGLSALDAIEDHPLAELRDQVRSPGKPLTATDIGFRIGPRLNAAGRIAHPDLGYRALKEGGSLLQDLDRLNKERQEMTREQTENANEMLQDLYGSSLPPLLCISSPRFHPGIVGLIAGRLTQEHGRPSLVGSEVDGIVRASLRSIPEYDLMIGLSSASALLNNFGGHKEAAGCTYRADVSYQLSDALIAHAEEALSGVSLAPKLHVDLELHPSQLSLSLLESLNSLEPYGKANPEPRFLLRNIQTHQVRSVGEGGAHLQFRLPTAKAIGFGLGHLATKLNQPIDIVCQVGLSEWNGRREVELWIQDIRVSAGVAEDQSGGQSSDVRHQKNARLIADS